MKRKSKNIICILLMVISLLLVGETIYCANKNIEVSENDKLQINRDNMTFSDMENGNNRNMMPDMDGSGKMAPPDMSDYSESGNNKKFKNRQSTSREKPSNDSISTSDEKTIPEKPTGEVDDSNNDEMSADDRMMTPPDMGDGDMSAPSVDNQENTKEEAEN